MDKELLIKELESLKEKFSSIVELFSEAHPGFSSNQNSELISSLYSTLKENLGLKLKDLEKRQKNGQLSELEQSVLLPACRDAHLELKVSRGTKAGTKMLSCLISGQNYFNHYLAHVGT